MKHPRPSTLLPLLLFTLALAPGLAQAHPGHGAGFSAGVAHPLSGLDHLLAMLAVGLWAALLGGRARWALPAAFLGVMTLGGALGLAGLRVAFAELVILSSVVGLGLMVLFAA